MSGLCRRLNQILSRDTQPFVQLPDHGNGQGSLAVQDFVDPVAAAYRGLQVFRRKAGLLHAKFDGLDGVREIDREVFRLVGLNKGSQHIQTVAVGRADELHVDDAEPVCDGNDQAVIIALDVEHNAAVLQHTGATVLGLVSPRSKSDRSIIDCLIVSGLTPTSALSRWCLPASCGRDCAPPYT